ncbi:MAG: nucleotide-binding protein [Rhodospirillaceae bacterium]|nr:nucleotide-binding protein [Rhodospirillaceae bacterium]
MNSLQTIAVLKARASTGLQIANNKELDDREFYNDAYEWDETNRRIIQETAAESLKRTYSLYPYIGSYRSRAAIRGILVDRSSLMSSFAQALEQELRPFDSSLPVKGAQPTTGPSIAPQRQASAVFVVHGHDDGAKEKVARTLEQLGCVAVILHEQPNQGKTLIEKFERYSDVGFAVVIISGDDVGYALQDGQDYQRQRARQNVVLELGYFIGRLGRDRVFCLLVSDVELPTDYIGVVYEPMDQAGAWKHKLSRELEVAGFSVKKLTNF